MKKWISLFAVVVILLGLSATIAYADSYYFQVPKAEVIYYINDDGSAGIEYTYQFINKSSSQAIEFVDIGMPYNSKYNYSSMSAEINGSPISHIAKSEYTSNAVEFGLGGNAIQPGESGTFHAFIWDVTNTIYKGTADESEAYAGSQFQPSYFESGTVDGTTDMTVILILPTGIESNEPRYYPPEGWPGEEKPESGYDDQGRIYYLWHYTGASMTSHYIFGASFPARVIPDTAIASEPSGSLSTGLFSEIFENMFCCGFAAVFIGIFGWGIYQGTAGAKKRKMKYLPPKISIEGHGIKRGLTAVEASILLEEPMDKVLTMVLFSVVKKNAATVRNNDPLKLKVHDPLPEKLRAYEIDFLRAFDGNTEAVRRKKLQELMVKLVRSVTKKMKGFSYKETVEYYQTIIDKAWKHVEAANTPEIAMKSLDEAMDWTMLDKDYEDRSKRVFTGPVYVPMWWGRYDPTFRTPAPAASVGKGLGKSVTSGRSGGQSVSLPHLPGSDFAASVVTGIQGFGANVIGDLTKFTGGVTNKTNPIPKSTSSGRSSGGSCACACASCACACAGGGR